MLGVLMRSCGRGWLGVLISGGLGDGRGSCGGGPDRGVSEPHRDKFGGTAEGGISQKMYVPYWASIKPCVPMA